MAELLELHDRARFELFAFSLGHPRRDADRARLERVFEHFIDVSEASDDAIVALARTRAIDIAVDLSCHTRDSRPGVFARRAAPVQAAYLGFPGTSAMPQMDYLIADRVVVPPEHAADYVEKLVWLPDSLMVHDTRVHGSVPTPHRADLGLPDDAFVFCCFCSSAKITPEMFDLWLRLLQRFPASVLWLHAGRANDAADNLRAWARSRGIDAARLVFAPTAARADHLARLPLADLFLDTFPYNGHATTCDALWTGLPVLTALGDTFASRVGASLLRAVGLDEWVVDSLAAYEQLAQALVEQPERLAALRRKLMQQRSAAPLFDTQRTTRRIEAAYQEMWDLRAAGMPPREISVPSGAA